MKLFIYLWRVNHCIIVQATYMYNAVRITKKGVSRGIRNTRWLWWTTRARKQSPFLFLKEKRALNFQLLLLPLPRPNKGRLRQQGDLFRGCFAAGGTAAYSTVLLLVWSSAPLPPPPPPCQYISESKLFLTRFFYVKLITPKKRIYLKIVSNQPEVLDGRLSSNQFLQKFGKNWI